MAALFRCPHTQLIMKFFTFLIFFISGSSSSWYTWQGRILSLVLFKATIFKREQNTTLLRAEHVRREIGGGDCQNNWAANGRCDYNLTTQIMLGYLALIPLNESVCHKFGSWRPCVGAGTSDNHLNFLSMDNFLPSFNSLHQKALSPSLYQAFTLDANRLNAPQHICQYVWSTDRWHKPKTSVY